MKFNFWIALIILFIIIDQLTKLAASHFGWPIFFNDQFAFSLPVPSILMYLIYIAVVLGMTMYVQSAWGRFSDMQKYAWAFVYAGGLSNIAERVLLGYVRDFIPVTTGMLNIADFFIFAGLIILLISNRSSLRATDKTL